MEHIENTDLLKDMACPECGHTGPFFITYTHTILMHDSGPDEEGLLDSMYAMQDDNTECECSECDYNGTIVNFK